MVDGYSFIDYVHHVNICFYSVILKFTISCEGAPAPGNTLVTRACHTRSIRWPTGQRIADLGVSSETGRGAGHIGEVRGMMTWVSAFFRTEEAGDSIASANRRERITQQELAAMFADDLGLRVLQKRSRPRGRKPRRFLGRTPNPNQMI